MNSLEALYEYYESLMPVANDAPVAQENVQATITHDTFEDLPF